MMDVAQAVTYTRQKYATVGLTLARVEYYEISTAAAKGRDVINDDNEARVLTDEWTVPNNAVDVFVVKRYVGATSGLAPRNGPCNKNAKGMDGVVVELIGAMGQNLAHEMCHYLGLDHRPNDSTNLMFDSVPNGGQLDAGQGATMRQHCFIEL